MKPRYSIVVPVWHELDTAPRLIQQIRALDGRGDCEIIVVDGDPGGSTIAHFDEGVVRITAARGRALQMNAGAAEAQGDVLAFVHADTHLPDTFFRDIDNVLETGAPAGAFALTFDSPRPIYRLMSWIVTFRSRVTRKPYGDQAIFMRADYFRKIGGYAPIPLMEDVELVRRIRRSGDRLGLAPSSVVTSSRRMEAEGVLRQVLRNTSITFLYNIGVSPRLLSRWYTDCHRISDCGESPAPPSNEGDDAPVVVLARPRDNT